jgi:hypothetical protein
MGMRVPIGANNMPDGMPYCTQTIANLTLCVNPALRKIMVSSSECLGDLK